MVKDNELDKFMEEEIKKDIDQSSTIDNEDLERKLGEMGFLWDRVSNKLGKDMTCFSCKKAIDEKTGFQVLEASSAEKGLVAFVSLCKNCIEGLKKKKE